MYTKEDLYYSLCPIGSIDLGVIIKKCNEWSICPDMIVDYAKDNLDFRPSFETGADNCNTLFYSLYSIRIQKLQELTVEALEIVNKVKIRRKLKKLKAHLEEKAYEEIHTNAFCSCFDSKVIDDELEYVKTTDELLNWVGKKEFD